jgi:hypothetical protein
MKYLIYLFLLLLFLAIISENLNNLPWTKPQPYLVTPTKIVNCEYSNNKIDRCQYTLKYQEKYFNFYVPKQITIGKDTTINIPPAQVYKFYEIIAIALLILTIPVALKITSIFDRN